MTRCDADPDELQGDADAIARAKTVAALAVLRQAGHPLEGAFDFLVTEDVRCAADVARVTRVSANEEAGHSTCMRCFSRVTQRRSFHLSCLNGFPGPYVKGARAQPPQFSSH